ncbi:MAG TPA: hypothetical protein GX510_07670 [Firmicutes bacterium]|nr:hypothetical protein [Candidatus Fermentithermobacillaceae bacterium]
MESGRMSAGNMPTIEEIERLIAEAIEKTEQSRRPRGKLEEAQSKPKRSS